MQSRCLEPSVDPSSVSKAPSATALWPPPLAPRVWRCDGISASRPSGQQERAASLPRCPHVTRPGRPCS